MDVLRKVKYGLTFALAAFMLLSAPPAVMGSETSIDPHQRVYDYADILTDSEEAELSAMAQAYSGKLNVHFVILTTDDESETVLETYSRNFYEQNIAGVDDIFECAMMTVNMGTRRVANDFYGELRTMISDNEASVIREGYTSDMSNEKYY